MACCIRSRRRSTIGVIKQMSYRPFLSAHKLTLAQVEHYLRFQWSDHIEIIKHIFAHVRDLEGNRKLYDEIERTYPIVKQEFNTPKSIVMVLQVIYQSSVS